MSLNLMKQMISESFSVWFFNEIWHHNCNFEKLNFENKYVFFNSEYIDGSRAVCRIGLDNSNNLSK